MKFSKLQIILKILIVISIALLFPAKSSFANESNNQSKKIDETIKWDELKIKAFKHYMCTSLYEDVQSPQNPLFHPSYEDLGQMVKKYIAPLVARNYDVPYSERSLEHIPLPGIETLPCIETVEKWRAMYEFRTVPYVEPPPKHPLFVFIDDAYQSAKKLFTKIVAYIVMLAILIGSLAYLYLTIKAIIQSNKWEFRYFLFAASITSPLVIAPFYYFWTSIGNDGTFISYLIVCVIYIASMMSIFITRKLLKSKKLKE